MLAFLILYVVAGAVCANVFTGKFDRDETILTAYLAWPAIALRIISDAVKELASLAKK